MKLKLMIHEFLIIEKDSQTFGKMSVLNWTISRIKYKSVSYFLKPDHALNQ